MAYENDNDDRWSMTCKDKVSRKDGGLGELEKESESSQKVGGLWSQIKAEWRKILTSVLTNLAYWAKRAESGEEAASIKIVPMGWGAWGAWGVVVGGGLGTGGGLQGQTKAAFRAK